MSAEQIAREIEASRFDSKSSGWGLTMEQLCMAAEIIASALERAKAKRGAWRVIERIGLSLAIAALDAYRRQNCGIAPPRGAAA